MTQQKTMQTTTRLSSILALALTAGFTFLVLAPASGQKTDAVRQKEACVSNLKSIHEAIQRFRRDQQTLPNWLSDLVPKYLADSSVLTCPAAAAFSRDKTKSYPHVADPKVPNAYVYEFCDGEMGAIAPGGKMKLRELRSLQMAVVGGDIPILRCLGHEPVLNVGFDGVVSESPLRWEEQFRDRVAPSDLQAEKLLARFSSATAQKVAVRPESRARKDVKPDRLLGKPAPNFELELLDGDRFELANHKGKDIVILDFWATWCGPCRNALPGLVEISKEYRPKNVLFQAVDLQEEPDTIRGYLKKSGLSFSVPLDKDGSVSELFGVDGIPHTVIVGKDGTVQAIHVGYSPDNKKRIQRELDDLLAGKKLAPAPKD